MMFQFKGYSKREISLLDLLVGYVSVVSLMNVLLLAIRYFYPIFSLGFSLIIVAVLLIIFRIKITLTEKRFSWIFIGILVISLLLRLNPNLYLTGGQDQGTYVSLSKQYEINHGLNMYDEVRRSLSDKAKNIYDIGNEFLGVEIVDLENSQYVMPFYPVFPSWMSIFGSIFGSDNRVFALTVFGVLSIVGIYLLAYEISNKNKQVGLLASFLLAINPLHVYFSRVPVSEMVYLTFLLFFLYFLTRFYNDTRRGVDAKLSLILSLLSANAMFYTRMNGIFFLPIIILIPVVSYLFSKDNKLSKILSQYSFIWVLLFFISFLFYREYLPYLFDLIVGKRLLDSFATPIFLLIFVSMTGLLTFTSLYDDVKRILKCGISFLNDKLPWIAVFLFIGLIFYGSYFYVNKIFIENDFSLNSFESFSLLKQLSFITTFLYLSPIGFALVPISFIYFRKKLNVKFAFLLISIMIFLVYQLGVIRLTQYLYYYARYQLSELIPLCTILISIYLVSFVKEKKFKIVFWIVIAFLTIYFGFFSIIQLREKEGSELKTYEYIDSLIDKDDILFVAKSNYKSFNQTVFPLKYYYNNNIVTLNYLSYIHKDEIQKIKNDYNNSYLLTTQTGLNRQYRGEFEYIGEVNFRHNYFVHCNRDEDAYFNMIDSTEDIPLCEYIIIPNRYYFGQFKAYLYRWE